MSSDCGKDIGGIPPRAPLGGLFTGQPFASPDYANVPITPDGANMIQCALNIGNAPPPQARYQYPCQERIGNSTVTTPGLVKDDWTRMQFSPTN